MGGNIKMYRICLIVTSSEEFHVIRRFFESLKIQCRDAFFEVFFVNQNKCSFDGFSFHDNVNLTVIEINYSIPLSVARNIALSHVNLQGFDVVAFPDDDCWYSENLIRNVLEYFSENASCSILCTNVMDPSNNKTYGGRPAGIIVPVDIKNIFSYPISVGIFIRISGDLINHIFFDETLGAGTDIGSGEETDLVYRLIKNNEKCIYVGNIFVYHPVVDSNYRLEDISKYYKYGVGFGYLTRRMVTNNDYIVLTHFTYIIFRTIIGCVFSLSDAINRKVYFYRLKGIFSGFLRKS
ncbi:glycosyltransferase family 2 protein [Aeromonas jandaei]|uniref:glycosyltransferase family 2 protein n=1 Tax=Aeromonas jandaei TaxID=650 RepID=UPI003B9FC99E